MPLTGCSNTCAHLIHIRYDDDEDDEAEHTENATFVAIVKKYTTPREDVYRIMHCIYDDFNDGNSIVNSTDLSAFRFDIALEIGDVYMETFNSSLEDYIQQITSSAPPPVDLVSLKDVMVADRNIIEEAIRQSGTSIDVFTPYIARQI